MLEPLLFSSMHALNGLQVLLEHAELPSLHAVYLQTSPFWFICAGCHTQQEAGRCVR